MLIAVSRLLVEYAEKIWYWYKPALLVGAVQLKSKLGVSIIVEGQANCPASNVFWIRTKMFWSGSLQSEVETEK